jgi:dTDP-glucose 4,6-dehydratase
VLTNCSNNYGPFHFPEKLIPLFINNIITNLCLFMGMVNIPALAFVEDHAVAIDLVFKAVLIMEPTLVVLMNGKILIW